MKIKDMKVVLCAIVVFFTVGSAHAASVRSISPEQVVEIDGQSVKEITIRCAEIDQPRFIQRKNDNDAWCAKALPTMCSTQSIVVAKKVCGSFFERSVAKYNKANPQPSAENVAKPNADVAESPSVAAGEGANGEPQSSIEEQALIEKRRQASSELERIEAERENIRLKQEQLDQQLKQLEKLEQTKGAEG